MVRSAACRCSRGFPSRITNIMKALLCKHRERASSTYSSCPWRGQTLEHPISLHYPCILVELGTRQGNERSIGRFDKSMSQAKLGQTKTRIMMAFVLHFIPAKSGAQQFQGMGCSRMENNLRCYASRHYKEGTKVCYDYCIVTFIGTSELKCNFTCVHVALTIHLINSKCKSIH